MDTGTRLRQTTRHSNALFLSPVSDRLEREARSGAMRNEAVFGVAPRHLLGTGLRARSAMPASADSRIAGRCRSEIGALVAPTYARCSSEAAARVLDAQTPAIRRWEQRRPGACSHRVPRYMRQQEEACSDDGARGSVRARRGTPGRALRRGWRRCRQLRRMRLDRSLLRRHGA